MVCVFLFFFFCFPLVLVILMCRGSQDSIALYSPEPVVVAGSSSPTIVGEGLSSLQVGFILR
jgi:hypothetical protein